MSGEYNGSSGLESIAKAITNSNVDYSKLILEILERGVTISPTRHNCSVKMGFNVQLKDKS